MQNHTKVYLKGMKIPVTQYFEDMGIICEWCEASPGKDIHHLIGRRSGGSKIMDTIENLMALCRECHLAAEARTVDREELQAKHLKNIP